MTKITQKLNKLSTYVFPHITGQVEAGEDYVKRTKSNGSSLSKSSTKSSTSSASSKSSKSSRFSNAWEKDDPRHLAFAAPYV